MKHCSYCGKACADDVAVCPIDGQPLVNPQEPQDKAAPPPPGARPSFDVQLVSPISSAGAYRVFDERSDLLFIQMEGGPKSILAAVAPLLGPLGGVIPLVLWLFTRCQAQAKRQRLETGDPEELLRESQASFKLNLAEIRDAAIEPPGLFAHSGKAGRLNLSVRHGEKIQCEFATAADVNAAIRLLVPLLNATLQVNVKWNAEKQRFEKTKREVG